MGPKRGKRCRLAVGTAAVGFASLALAPSAMAAVPVRLQWIPGFPAPGTPAKYDKVGILETGLKTAKNVLVLNPGTSAGSAYFEPLAKDVVTRAPGWQVWSVERRENLFEDQSVIDQAKQGKATGQQLFDYYLGWLNNKAITSHIQLIPDSTVTFAREWGLNVAMNDLREVVLKAKKLGGHVVVGGHSRGASEVTAYATWDFNGKAGADGLSGLVYDDGGSNPTPVVPAMATQELGMIESGTPWLSFSGIPAPFLGLFSAAGATGALINPNGPSLGQSFPQLPASLKPSIPVTNLALFGYDTDVKTSHLVFAAQAHVGQLDTSVTPARWSSAGALTPIQRWASMLSGWGLKGIDGSEWYYPQRLATDLESVAEGNANPAQSVLGVHATMGHQLPRQLRIYAFGAFGGPVIENEATVLANQSHIPLKNLTLANFQGAYAHNDPAGATPDKNAFLHRLLRFLQGIGRERGS